MAAAEGGSLFESTDCASWRAALGCYEEVVELVAAQKNKKGRKSKEDTLVQLDAWFQKTLNAAITSRCNPHLTHAELVKLMRWKLTRGKFRPRLTQLVQQNSPQDVESITKAGIAALPDFEKAIGTLTQLKAVGPATASAILCAAAPDKAPFMADESVLAVPGLGKLDYSLKHYLAYAKRVKAKAKQLNSIGKSLPDRRWTPHDVEQALWAFHFAQKLKPELLRSESERQKPSQQENSDSEEEPPRKKHKQ